MSIINKRPELVKREYELEDIVVSTVEKYATFIESTPDHVVVQKLHQVRSKLNVSRELNGAAISLRKVYSSTVRCPSPMFWPDRGDARRVPR